MTERIYDGNQHKYSVKPMEHIVNMLTPARLTSDEILLPAGSTAPAQSQFQTLNSDPNYTFQSYSFFVSVPVFFSLNAATELNTQNGRRHFFEGGRFTATTTSSLKTIYFRPVDAPTENITVYIMVG
jgi:hypothetical protein